MKPTPNIHILGIQGSGKGTQSAKLVERFGLTYIASGNLFRERAGIQDDLGRQIAEELQKGHLLPDELLVSTIDHFLQTTPVPVGLLCDGVIRTTTQRMLLEPIWHKHGLDEPVLINLVLSDEIAVERIALRQQEAAQGVNREHHQRYSGKLLQRTDANPAAIQERIRLFHSMTQPVIAHYESRGRCISVDASLPIEPIFTELCEKLSPWLS